MPTIKTVFFHLLGLGLVMTTAGTSQADVSLENARTIKTTQEAIPRFEARMKDKCKATIALEIDWGSFGNDRKAILNIEHQAAERAANGVANTCNEKLAQERLAQKIQKVTIRNIGDKSKKKIKVAPGTLTIEAAYAVDEGGYFTDNDIRRELEKNI